MTMIINDRVQQVIPSKIKATLLTLSEGNKKLASNGTQEFLIWNIPSISTCPYSTENCRKMCYAMKAERMYPNVKASRQLNYANSLRTNFVDKMIETINHHLNRKKYQGKQIFFRIHESGDFYNIEYMKKWIDIARHFMGNDRITFLAYTKSVPFLDKLISEGCQLPSNLVFRSSLWSDTTPENIDITVKHNLPVYTAMTQSELDNKANKVLACQCDCKSCKACYYSNIDKIACKIH